MRSFLPATAVAGRRWAAVEHAPDRRQRRQRQTLDRLKERYVRGELTLAEYEAAVTSVLAPASPARAAPPEDPAGAPLRLAPRRAGGLRTVVGAVGTGATLVAALGLLLARGLRPARTTPPQPPTSQGPVGLAEPAALVVEVLVVRTVFRSSSPRW